jgi:UDP-N-acetylglucosamine:LPS N-acetylglucosamine transferase
MGNGRLSHQSIVTKEVSQNNIDSPMLPFLILRHASTSAFQVIGLIQPKLVMGSSVYLCLSYSLATPSYGLLIILLHQHIVKRLEVQNLCR